MQMPMISLLSMCSYGLSIFWGIIIDYLASCYNLVYCPSVEKSKLQRVMIGKREVKLCKGNFSISHFAPDIPIPASVLSYLGHTIYRCMT